MGKITKKGTKAKDWEDAGDYSMHCPECDVCLCESCMKKHKLKCHE